MAGLMNCCQECYRCLQNNIRYCYCSWLHTITKIRWWDSKHVVWIWGDQLTLCTDIYSPQAVTQKYSMHKYRHIPCTIQTYSTYYKGTLYALFRHTLWTDRSTLHDSTDTLYPLRQIHYMHHRDTSQAVIQTQPMHWYRYTPWTL